MKIVPVLVSAAFALTVLPVVAQQIVSAPGRVDCAPDEPDPVQINWNTPCEVGDWLLEPGVGCRMWDWHPDPQDKASWSGSCRGALKEGRGTVQWTEHGQSVDRFEGTYRNGRREGVGRYSWNATSWFEGNYSNDIPDGPGTVSLDGVTLSGVWHKGCLATDDKVVAIGVPRASCEARPQETANLK